jgi:hypothetical protein
MKFLPYTIASIAFVTFLPGLKSVALPVEPNSPCYMVNSTGRIINLNGLCPGKPQTLSRGGESPVLSAFSQNEDLVIGTVTNNTSKPVQFVKVSYEIRNPETNELIGKDFAYTIPTTINPGQSANFKGVMTKPGRVASPYLEWQSAEK